MLQSQAGLGLDLGIRAGMLEDAHKAWDDSCLHIKSVYVRPRRT